MSEGASLTVLGGPLAGTRLDIDDAVDEILVGSDPDCRFFLDAPGVSPIHARIWRDLGGVTVYDTRSPRGVYVNDDRVADQAALRDGDVLWLGPPGDPDSVMLQCRLPQEGLLDAPQGELGPPPEPEPAPEAEPQPEPEPEAPAGDAGVLDDLLEPALPPAPPYDDGPGTIAFVPPSAEDLVPPPEAMAAPIDEPAGEFMELIEPEAAPGAALPPVDLDALIDEPADAAPPAAAAEPEPFELAAAWEMPATRVGMSDEAAAAAPEPAPTLPVDEKPPAPVAAAPAVPVAAAPVAPPAVAPPAVAPLAARAVPAPPAIIDDRPARPSPPREAPPKPLRTPRSAETEGIMDWARATTATTPESTVPPAGRDRAASARRGGRSRARLLAPAGAVLVLLPAAGGYYAWTVSRTPVVSSVSPPRVRVGDTVTLGGSHLGESVGEVSVTIAGRPARVIRASGSTLQVEVPQAPTTPGRDTAVPVLVTAGGRRSKPASVSLFRAPRLVSLSPDAGMPGDRITIAGDSLGEGVAVRFGAAPAQVVSAAGDTVTVTVPALAVARGAEVPVVATMGPDSSNALDFAVGTLPLVTSTDLRAGMPGELVTVVGRGFAAEPALNRVTVAGVPALVVSSSAREIKAVVPRAPAGESTLEVALASSSTPGRIPFAVTGPPEPVGFLFVAEPFADAAGHDHAAIATGLGPAFVLTGAGGRTAAARAYDAQVKLNEAGRVLASSREADVRAHLDPPSLYLYGRNSVLLEVTAADAAAYDEDWTRARARAPATPARLATWWEAVARDLVLLLVRGEKPHHAAELSAEGKALADLHDAARRSVAIGVPSGLVGERAPLREAVRVVGLRLPASVPAPAAASAAAPTQDGAPPADPAAATTPPLKLDGSWDGIETEGGVVKSISIAFRGGSGTLTYQRALTMTVPVLGVAQPQRGAVQFEVPTGGGRKFYRGRWDGTKITGTIASDAAGGRQTGTFELQPD